MPRNTRRPFGTGGYSVLTAAGARKVLNDDGSAYDGPLGVPKPPARKPGRPPASPGTAATMAAPLTAWRAILTTIELARDAPRAAETVRSLDEASSAIRKRLGPAVDPDYVPDRRKVATQYKVREWDGTETLHDNAATAALTYGCAVSSLATMLNRGGGKCQKLIRMAGEQYSVTCAKVDIYLDAQDE